MKKIITLICFHIFIFTISYAFTADAIVAADSSGDYTTIQEAINAAPSGGSEQFIIYIKNGTYNEKLYFEKSYISLVGENRDSTIIVTAELRRVWRETNESDWGVATVNIKNEVTDLTFANLTIKNNFADVNPDFADNNDHTMAIRGGGHRIIIINCNVIATGGDTVSLWNTGGGMFYHNNCYFEGYVDYVCPRGYCYITDCDFYGYNGNASIWHDGSGGKDHKFVIRNSYFDGIQYFGLGRYHKDAAFYLLDCKFSENLKNNGGILYVGSDGLKWGHRAYYYNCHSEGIDLWWFENNLHDSTTNPHPDSINALWTFNSNWNPESKLEDLIPFACIPYPVNHRKKVDLQTTLSWVAGKDVISHNVYFGTENPPPFIQNQTESQYTPQNLEEANRYYWRIDEITDTDTIPGEVWDFSTGYSTIPEQAINPVPADSSSPTGVVNLTWEYNNITTDSFLLYFGTSQEVELVKRSVYPGYMPVPLISDTKYYWRVNAKNEFGTTQGELWNFTYYPSPITSNIEQVDLNSFYIDFSYLNTVNQYIFKYNIPYNGFLKISLYNINGQLINTIYNGNHNKGIYEIVVDNELKSNSRGSICFLTFNFNGIIKTFKLI
ncbi:pectinesterase family protein [Bacteroidota bacterium]